MRLCWVCGREAEYLSPADLCEEHWQQWIDYDLSPDDLVDLPEDMREHLLDNGE